MTNETPTTELRVGDSILDNDPRMPGRILKVTAIQGSKVQAETKGATTRISRSRIHLDGKPRRSGWTLIRNEDHG